MGIAGGKFLPAMTPLHEAALHGADEMAKMLIDENADVNAKAYWGRTPLHISTAMLDKPSWFRLQLGKEQENRRVMMCRLLVEAKADVNAQDLDEETPLLYSTKQRNRRALNVLLDAGVQMDLRNIHGETAPD